MVVKYAFGSAEADDKYHTHISCFPCLRFIVSPWLCAHYKCSSYYYYSASVGVQSIVITPSICLSVCVCLSVSISLERLDRSARNFVCGSPVTVARSSSGSIALRYVLLVLWMTSRLTVMGATPKGGGWTVTRLPWAAWRYRGGVWCLWMPCY